MSYDFQYKNVNSQNSKLLSTCVLIDALHDTVYQTFTVVNETAADKCGESQYNVILSSCH